MNKKITTIIAGIVAPILIGAFIYILMSPNIYFTIVFWKIVGIENPFINININKVHWIFKLLRYYGCDFLWAFSFTNVINLILKNENVKTMIQTIVICVLFFIFYEISQLVHIVPGTFDLVDFSVEVAANFIAVIFYIFSRRNKE